MRVILFVIVFMIGIYRIPQPSLNSIEQPWAVTLLLEFSAWFLGGEVEKIKNQLTMNRAQLLDIQNMNMFGVSMQDVNSLAFEANTQLESDRQKAEKEIEKLRQNRTLPAGQTAQKVQEIRARSGNKTPSPSPKNTLKKHQIGFINTNNQKAVDVDKTTVTESVYTESVITDREKIKRIEMLYLKSQETKGKTEVVCPVCEKAFTKTGFKIFCSNKGKGNCSDEYHNIMKPERLTALANKRRKQGLKVKA